METDNIDSRAVGDSEDVEQGMKLTLPYPVSLNRMYRFWNGKFLISAVGRAYKEECSLRARIQKARIVEGELKVSAYLFRPAKRGDLDNSMKVLLDSLNGICWNDDSQLVELHIYRSDDKKNPRVEVEIEKI